MKKKVIIVGAGPGGLTAGMILSHRGFDVEIYEKNTEVGGRNGYIELEDYRFDIGPTFFMMKDVLKSVFYSCGEKLEECVDIIKIDPMYRLKFSNDRVFYPSNNKDLMEKEMERFSSGSFKNYEKYLEKEKKKYDRLIPCLQVPYDSILDFFKWRFLRTIPYLDSHISLYNVLGRYFEDPLVKLAFTFQAKYIGMSPWMAPGTFSIIPFIEHYGGIYHIKGGLNRLSKAMAKIIIKNGGKIYLDHEVNEILIENGEVKGVNLVNGSKKKSDITVINADFAYAMSNLVEEKWRKKYDDVKLATMKYSCSTFMLYLGVNREFENISHHSILFADDYKKNVEDITTNMVISDDFSFYVQNASVTDKTLAPKGKSAIYVLVPVPNNNSNIDWDKEKRVFTEKILNKLETIGEYKGITKKIEVTKIITPKDWEHEYNVYLGATFNLAHTTDQMLVFRPHNRFKSIKNLYLVGGGTHPGSGLPTIYESGKISSNLIINDYIK